MRQRRQAERGHFTHVDREHQRSRQEAERRSQRLIIAGAAVALTILAVILLAGYYSSIFRPPRQVVAEVGSVEIRLREVSTYANLFLRTGGLDIQDLGLLPEQMFQMLVRHEVLRQAAPPSLGIAVLPEEVDQQIVFIFEPPPEDPDAPGATSLSEAGQEQYESVLDIANITDTQYRRLLEGQLLESLVRDRIDAFVPQAVEQVFLHWIVVADAAQGEAVKERLDDGEEFAAVALDLNQERIRADEIGEVGWVPRGLFPELDETIFSAEVGTYVGPLETSFGIVVAQISQGPQEEELTGEVRVQIVGQSTDTWFLEQYVLLVGIDPIVLDNDDRDWVLDRLDIGGGQLVPPGG